MGSVSQTADITLFLTKLSFTSPSVALMFFKGSAGNSDAQPGLCPVGLGKSGGLPHVEVSSSPNWLRVLTSQSALEE